MIDIYLCEDNIEQLNSWKNMIHDYLLMHDLDERLFFASTEPKSLLEELKRQRRPSDRLYFLDICLNADMNGLELASRIRNIDPLGDIVFITSHSEMCAMTYQYQLGALDFIVKDRVLDLSAQIAGCLQTADKRRKQIRAVSSEPLYIKVGSERIYINPDEILYIEADRHAAHKIMIHTGSGMKNLYGTLKELKVCLDKHGDFVYCHRSCIVNRKHIRKVDKKAMKLILDGGSVCSVSHRHLKDFQSI